MATLTKLPEWQALQEHYKKISPHHMRDWFAADPHRFEKFSLHSSELFLDYSKNRITEETLSLLCKLADATHLSQRIDQLFSGHLVNSTEERAALHTALRSSSQHPLFINGQNVTLLIQQTLAKMRAFSEQLRNGLQLGYSNKAITDVVNIGIGGSDLGPKMVTEALSSYKTTSLNCHFISNVDGSHITETLKKLNPETTLFIISSKSFTTLETLANANTAKQWIIDAFGNHDAIAKHFIAITACYDKANSFGIPAQNMFEIGDWVGGRYSLWSAIGLPIVISIGMDSFEQLLAGAYAMDQHFRNNDWSKNMPVILALLGIWYINFFNTQTHAIIPYNHYLEHFTAYLQQADMESNGKQVTHQGHATYYATSPIIWGEVGCNGQHAFHQLFHQGAHLVPIDFIICANHHHALPHHHTLLFADCLSQSQALMWGKTEKEILAELQTEGYPLNRAEQLAPHKAVPGNRPSNTLVLPQLTPYTLGALLALYEHKIFVQGAIWDINSFDQWGVELGKHLANAILDSLSNHSSSPIHDCSTSGLLEFYRKNCRNLKPL